MLLIKLNNCLFLSTAVCLLNVLGILFHFFCCRINCSHISCGPYALLRKARHHFHNVLYSKIRDTVKYIGFNPVQWIKHSKHKYISYYCILYNLQLLREVPVWKKHKSLTAQSLATAPMQGTWCVLHLGGGHGDLLNIREHLFPCLGAAFAKSYSSAPVCTKIFYLHHISCRKKSSSVQGRV